MPRTQLFRPLSALSQSTRSTVAASCAFLLLAVLTGCQTSGYVAPVVVKGQSLSGEVHGGQQPVAGALIQLYVVGTTGDASAATPLIGATVTTSDGTGTADANANAGNNSNKFSTGAFTITGDFTCPANAQVYLTATGGNPGLAAGTNNTAIAMMSFLGSCSALTAATSIQINEITTVGSLASISAYTASYNTIGSATSDASQFSSALAQIPEYVNVNTGVVPGPSLPAGFYASSTEIQTLGDIVANCINSTGPSQTACSSLFTLATPSGGSAPTNTIAAIANILNHPSSNVSAIYNLLTSNGPFQPTLTSAPSSWQLPILQIPASPTFSPGAGTYVGAQSITINETTFGVSVYYTTDGSTPTTSSALYSSPITVTASETINAIASYAGRANSPVIGAAYVITAPPPAATPTFSVTPGTYSASQTVTISSTTPGAFIYYTTDGSTPTTSAPYYSGPVTVYETENLQAIAISSTTSASPIGSAAYVITTYYGTISTVAGNGLGGYTGDGIQATSAEIYYPYGTITDSTGNIYIADFDNNRVRKVTPAGLISTVAGNGVAGFSGDGGQAASAELYGPDALALDSAGNLYIDDDRNFRIRKVTPAGIISTFAGNGSNVEAGDGGQATSASFTYSCAIIIDPSSNMYIADCGSAGNKVRKVTPAGIISTVVGTGATGSSGDGGLATAATVNSPEGLAIDQAGNLYVAEYGGSRVRKVNAAGIISTYAGTGTASYGGDGGAANVALLNSPEGISLDAAGNLYIADSGNNRVRKVTPAGIISTAVGNGTGAFAGDGGPAVIAELYYPAAVQVDASGDLIIGDLDNQRIRKVTFGNTAQAVGAPSFSLAGGTYNGTQYLTLSSTSSGASIYYTTNGTTPTASSTLYSGLITISSSQTINAIAILTGYANSSVTTASYTITNLSTTATPTFSPAPGIYNATQSVTLSTTSSGATIYYTLDGTTPTTASKVYSAAITVSSSETISAIAVSTGFAASTEAQGGFYINQGTGIITTIAGNGTQGFTGDGGSATSAEIYNPRGMAVDSSGNVYFADSSNNRIRKVTPAGIITTVAGTGTSGFAGDGGLATAASLYYPSGVAIDLSGNLYIADADNYRVRKVNTSGIISTVAGSSSYGYSGDNGLATSASLTYVVGVAVDLSGNLYIADEANSRIRKVNTAGIITTFAGSASSGFAGDGGAATSASLYDPYGVAADASGNVYIADEGNNRIRKVNAAGIISTFAGSASSGYSGDGGAATSAALDDPEGVWADTAGNVYIADYYNYRIRKVFPSGTISTIAGIGYTYSTSTYNGDGEAATLAYLDYPTAVVTDSIGNVYIADSSNQRIRKVSYGMAFQATAPTFSVPAGTYTAVQYLTMTSPTSGAAIYYTTDGTTPTTSSTLYSTPVALSSSQTITAVTTAPGYSNSATTAATYSVTVLPTLATPTFSPVAGTYTSTQTVTITPTPSNAAIYYTVDGTTPTTSSTKYTGAITVSAIETINAIAVLSGYNPSLVATAGFYINPTPGIITTIAGDGGYGTFAGDGSAATSASLYNPHGVVVDPQGNVYIADTSNSRVRKINYQTGIITTIAGNGTSSFAGDSGLAVNAELSSPQGLALDSAGNLYIADEGNNRIRKVNTAGIITTIAGNGTGGYTGDAGSAIAAEIYGPMAVAVDAAGNLYIADYNNNRIRKVTPAGIITTIAGTGTAGYNGDGIAATSATLYYPDGVAVDAAGNVYIADYYNQRIRKVTTSTGVISTYVGGGGYGFGGDGGPAANAAVKMEYPTSVVIDSSGNLYFADYYNYRIRVVTPAGNLSTAVGNGTSGFTGDAGLATGAEITTVTAIGTDSAGNLYLSDGGNERIRKVTY